MAYRKKGTPKEESFRLNQLAMQVALSNGGTVKNGHAESVMSSLEFTCSEGHKFTKTIRAVTIRGGWCDFCRLSLPSNKSELSKILIKSHWKLLSDYKPGQKKFKVQCEICSLEREGTFRTFEGKPCRHFARSAENPSLRIKQKVATLDGEILTRKITNLESKVKFECKLGHQFSLRARDVVTRNTWCPECNPHVVTARKINNLIAERGGELLSKIPTNVTSLSKILIKCSSGHEFSNDWAHMSPPRNGWCSICTKGNKSEEIARATFRQLFGGDFRKARPKWLRNSRGYQMELDGYEEKLRLAFEYQGRQHFENVGIFSGESQLKQRIRDDKTKLNLCKKNGVTLIILSWDMEYIDFPKFIEMQLTKVKPELSLNVDFNSQIDLNSAFIKDDRLQELKAILETRNLKLLSTKWISVSHRYEISCNVCGYQFTQPARSYINSRKVAGCKKCAMKENIAHRKLGYGALTQVASRHGGKCFSKEYVTSKTKYEWLCGNGHRFSRSLDSIKSKGTFCPLCPRKL
jgi:hypothetical protein